MTKKNLKELVDQGFELDRQIKLGTKELNEIKKVLKEEAAKADMRELEGEIATVLVSPTSQSQADPEDVYHLMKSRKMTLQQFLSVVSVSVPKFEELVGKSMAEEVVIRKGDSFGRVSFKKKEK